MGATTPDLLGKTDNPKTSAGVLFVDLDGTLIRTDLFLESMLLAVRRQPRILLETPRWLFGGRAALKRTLAQRAAPDLRRMPLREKVFEHLVEQRALGVRIVLATASDRILADEIAAQFGLFDDVLASDGHSNLKGKAKLAAIEDYCRRNGFQQFSYLGDAWADLPIWQRAATAAVVEPTAPLLAAIRASCATPQVIEARHSRWRHVLRVLRPQQWVKNVLLFASVFMAHELFVATKLFASLWAFLVFCCCASATYVLNDLLDIEADRAHPIKRRRPFAAGDLPVTWGPPLALGLFVLGAGIAVTQLPAEFLGFVLLYMVITLLYSVWLKRVVMVDVFILSGLYTLRIFAGGAATHTPISEWLMALSLFMFTSLAFGKRYIELSQMSDDEDVSVRGRGYQVGDLSLLESIGPTSGYLAALVFALYINGDAVKRLYPHPGLLWLICPLMLYWVSRFWILAKRRVLSDDPILFALKDRVSLGVGLLTLLLAAGAAWRH